MGGRRTRAEQREVCRKGFGEQMTLTAAGLRREGHEVKACAVLSFLRSGSVCCGSNYTRPIHTYSLNPSIRAIPRVTGHLRGTPRPIRCTADPIEGCWFVSW